MGIPWSVKGIDTEAREAAKHAARRSGMSLGEWLNTVIREQADEIEPQKPVPRNAVLDIQSKLDHLSEQLTRMANHDQDTAAGRYYERSRPAPADHSLADILARVEASERQMAEYFARFGERIEASGDKFTKDAGRNPQNPEGVPGYRSLETAVRNIVDHIVVSERNTRDTLAVQERPNEIANAAGALIDSNRRLADAPVIARLENRIVDPTNRVPGQEGARLQDVRKLVQDEFGKLVARIDSVKQASELAAQRAQTQAVRLAQEDLRDFESRVQDSFAKSQAGSTRPDDGELGRLRAEMDSLGQRVDDLTVKSASEHDLQSLKVVIEKLSARVAQGPDLRPLADLDRRLTQFTKLLEQSRGGQVGNQIAELERRVFDLDKRIAQAMQQDQGAQAWVGLDREIAGLSGRLANTEQRLQHLATLEQSIQQLCESMEQNRNWARVMQDWSAKAHETLEEIVNKLTELEMLRDHSVSAEPAGALADAAAEIPQTPAAGETWPVLRPEGGAENYTLLDPSPSLCPAEPAPSAAHDDFVAGALHAAQGAGQQTPGPTAAGFLDRGKSVETADHNRPRSSRCSRVGSRSPIRQQVLHAGSV